MSVHINHRPSDRPAARDAGLASTLFLRWVRSAIRSWQRRRTIATLAALDDRTLYDIGIPRGEIERVVDGFDDPERPMTPAAPATEAQDRTHAELRRAA